MVISQFNTGQTEQANNTENLLPSTEYPITDESWWTSILCDTENSDTMKRVPFLKSPADGDTHHIDTYTILGYFLIIAAEKNPNQTDL